MAKTLEAKNIRIIEYYLPFYILLSQYKFGIITLGEIGLMLCAVMYAVRCRGRLVIEQGSKDFAILLFFVVIRRLLDLFNPVNEAQLIFNSTIELVVIGISVLVIVSINGVCFDENKLFNVWRFAWIVYTIGLVYQLVRIYVFSSGISPISIIPGYSLRAEALSVTNRPSSFFVEPASFASAVLPLLFMSLKHRKYKLAFCVTLTIYASTSTVGIVLSAVMWLLFIIYQKSLKRKIKIGAVVFFIILITVVMNLDFFTFSSDKIMDALNGGSTVSSRIICGLDVIKLMDPLQWIMGTTYWQASDYVNVATNIPASSPVYVYMRASGYVFLNTFCEIIFGYGVVGMLVYLSFYKNRLVNKASSINLYIITILVSIFAQSKFFNSIFFMEMLFILLYEKVHTGDVEL